MTTNSNTALAVEMSVFDEAKASAFEDRFVTALNGGALCLMTSIGHRTGLFDAMSTLSPSKVDEIAAVAKLNERYVREWLGAMVTGGVIELDPEAETYSLPPEHAGMLTRAATPDNMAVFAQYIPLLGSVEEDIVECFRNGGGVPYEKFDRFHEVMAEDSGQSVLPALKDHILPLVPGIQEALENGISVMDLGCGRGRALNLMASWYPNSSFIGYDLSEEAIAYGRAEAERLGNTNISFEVRDLQSFDQDAPEGAFDLITTFDAIHDQPNPRGMLKGIRRALSEDGVYLAQDINASSHHHGDIDHPIGTLLYTVSCMHCMTVSLAQEGEGLGAMWGREKANELMGEAGFGQIDVFELDHDVQNAYYVCRP